MSRLRSQTAWSLVPTEDLRVLRKKLSGSNRYDEPVASRLWLEINNVLERRGAPWSKWP